MKIALYPEAFSNIPIMPTLLNGFGHTVLISKKDHIISNQQDIILTEILYIKSKKGRNYLIVLDKPKKNHSFLNKTRANPFRPCWSDTVMTHLHISLSLTSPIKAF